METTNQIQENQTETSASTAEENNSKKQSVSYGHDKMIFLVLLEAAMRYREAYWRDEVQSFEEIQKTAFEAYCEKNKIGFSKKQKMLTRMSADNSAYRNEYEKFNALAYAEIRKSVKEESLKSGTPFDNYSASWGLAAQEFVRAKNTTELLTLMKSYNDGAFDDALEHVKSQQVKTEEDAQ